MENVAGIYCKGWATVTFSILQPFHAAYDGPKGFPHGFHCYEEKFIPLTNPLMVVGHHHIFCC